MKTKLLFTLCCFTIINTFSQDLIAVQNGGTPKFYEDINEAITNANAGDTLYLPGKSYEVELQINKKLHLVGKGYNITNNKEATILTPIPIPQNNPQIKFLAGSEGSSVTGIRFTKHIINLNFSNIHEIVISRNYFEGGITGNNANNSLIFQNIFNGFLTSHIDNGNLIVSNNVFLNGIGINGNNLKIENNIFTELTCNCIMFYLQNSQIKNNVFSSTTINNSVGSATINNCIFINNLNIENGSEILKHDVANTSSVGYGNFITSLKTPEIFNEPNYQNFPDMENGFRFELPANSPYKNAGTDGTDLGIYGGRFPWKVGGAPFNPQITLKEIPGTTDENGKLNIKIEVEAQKN